MRAARSFPVVFLIALGASGCTTTAPVTTVSMNAADADAAWQTISSNASAMGASAARVDPASGVVSYSGAPRDYVECSRRGVPADGAQQMVVIDSRTTVEALGPTPRARTLYLATVETTPADGTPISRTAAFSETSSARFGDGVTCRATGALEQKIFASG